MKRCWYIIAIMGLDAITMCSRKLNYKRDTYVNTHLLTFQLEIVPELRSKYDILHSAFDEYLVEGRAGRMF